MRHSILDLCSVPEGSDAAAAIEASVALAQAGERAGYHRHWFAEHHNMAGIASAATSILIGRVAQATSRIRVGAGGIMLPNHAPLAIAEQFGTLETMYPGRIDLGLGRAPGGDAGVMRAFRSGARGETFPQDVMEVQAYLGDGEGAVQAHPGRGTHVPLWILGSSLFGAQLAAHLGLPYAFASHFAPDMAKEAADIYRARFQPGQIAQPHFMLAVNVFAADTDAEGARLRTSMQQAFARLRTGRPGKLPRPVDDIDAEIGARMRVGVDQALRVTACGSAQTVRAELAAIVAEHRPDEVILASGIHDPAARLRSYEIAAEVMADVGAKVAA